MDLPTVGNMTFSGDTRNSIMQQKYNKWMLVVKNVDLMDQERGEVHLHFPDLPEQSISVFVRVHGKDEKLALKITFLCFCFYTILR